MDWMWGIREQSRWLQVSGLNIFSDGIIINWDEEIRECEILLQGREKDEESSSEYVEFEISNSYSSVGVSRLLGVRIWDMRKKNVD